MCGSEGAMRRGVPRDSRAGFTLIEVLVAMIILAVGLLGLEALGIAAARATAQAQHRTVLAAHATQALEDQVRQTRLSAVLSAQAETCETHEEVGVRVCTQVVTAGMPPNAARIEVRANRTVGQPFDYELSSYVFR
jgi:type IV pilus modification protein PilV